MRLMQSMALRVALAATIVAGVSCGCGRPAASKLIRCTATRSRQHTTSTTSRATSAPAPSPSSTKPAPVVTDDAALRIEGEKRFRTNCGRCHMAPHKFPPRTMATAVRHMRVRAMITDEDMRLILRYLTQ